MASIQISPTTARRYILGRQGLWPGRRWQGLRGTDAAMRAMEHLQLDPLNVVARAHDLMLQSRVIGYEPGQWEILTHQKRHFFEWGGWLAVRPIEELPYWRVIMRRHRESRYSQAIAVEHTAAIEEMRAVLRERDSVSNRDFAMASRKRVNSYRGRKDSAVALHYLWRIGEAMVIRRDRFERVYAATDAIIPPGSLPESSGADADDFMLRKLVAAEGLTRFTGLSGVLYRPTTAAEVKTWRDSRVADGTLIEVTVEGWKGPRWALGADVGIIKAIASDRVPSRWRVREATTDEEATFLSPLDPVSARGRASQLFDFEYKWEVYTPAADRQFGYYTLPVLWRDGLVARFDSRLDRSSDTLVINGLWLEDTGLGSDRAFAQAMERGMRRFVDFLGAKRVDATAVGEPRIRRALSDAASG